MKYIQNYLEETEEIVNNLDKEKIFKVIILIKKVKIKKGRIFFLGVGGGAGHSSHAVNDFRKIAGIECYAPTDNVSELTARINDDGWESSYKNWLKISKLSRKDLVFVFSDGGGNIKKKISLNLVNALKYSKKIGCIISGIAGKKDGYLSQVSNNVLIVPEINPNTITAHTEGMQAVLWHLIISHPDIQTSKMKWESQNK